jgi:hypothetical protein
MHYSINSADITTEIQKLGHTVTNIWNIKQNRTKLPLSMFFVKLKLAPNNKMYSLPKTSSSAKSNLNLPSTNGILLNAQTAKDTDTQRTTAISNHDASNAQVITPHSTVTEWNARMMSDVFSVVATIPLTTKDAPFTGNSSKKTYPSLRPKQYLPPAPLQRTLHTSPGITYAQIAKHTPATSPTTQDPHPRNPYHKPVIFRTLKK